MEDEQKKEEEEESLKEDLKEEGTFFVKDLVVGTAGALKRAGHGVINAFTSRPKVKDLKEEVEEHTDKIREEMSE